MGWPLAVSAGLMGKGRRDLIASLGSLGAGHFLAMAAILAPFAVMTALVAWQREIRIGAGLVVIAAGAHLLVARRHPRFLARTKPTQLALWSFAIATAHGAGLMLLPIYLGICTAGEQDADHLAAAALMRGTSGRLLPSRLSTPPR
jgi:cytochrome c biogenesis protein CcdA